MNRLPSLTNHNILTKKEERALLLKASKGDKDARNFLIESNQGLVLKIASGYVPYSTNGLTIEDLIQEGNMGLIRAVDKFKVSKKVRLGTYATYWIRQKISIAIIEKGRLVHIPSRVQAVFRKVVKKLEKNPKAKISSQDSHLLKRLGFEVTKDSILGATPASIDNEDILTYVPESLRTHNRELESRINILDVEKFLSRHHDLTDMQKKIICHKIGLYGDVLEFKDIAKLFGITTFTAQNYFKKAMFILRNAILEEQTFRLSI